MRAGATPATNLTVTGAALATAGRLFTSYLIATTASNASAASTATGGEDSGTMASALTAEELVDMGGMATVALLHALMPTHWLPFSIVGQAQKWTLSKTLVVSK